MVPVDNAEGYEQGETGWFPPVTLLPAGLGHACTRMV